MIRAVFDTSTVVAAIFWPRSTARRAWTLVARRQVRPCVTAGIEDEYQITCLDIQRSRFPDRDLLALGKPFGVAVLTPIELLKRVV